MTASRVHLACQQAFQFFCGEAQTEVSFYRHGYAAGLFRAHYGYGVAVLRDAECGTVAQS